MEKTDHLKGDLSFLGFADLLQLLGSISSTGILNVWDEFEFRADIYFDQGEVINAEFRELKGAEAFFIPFSFKGGHFSFKEIKPDCERTMANNLTGLILEGLRLLDEGRLEGRFKNFSFKSTIPPIRGTIVDYSEIVDEEFFEKDEIIVSEGRYGSWIWVILDGIVQVERKLSNTIIPISQMGRGCFIGSLAAFSRGNRPRSATVRAITPVQLGVLDAQSLSKDYSRYSDPLKDYFIAVDYRLKKLTDLYLKVLTKEISNYLIPEDVEGLINEKVKDGKLGMITSGKADFFFKSAGKVLNLGSLGKGDMTGELPFIEKSSEYHFAIACDKDFAIRPFEKKVLADEFAGLSENVKKMVEFSGLTLSVTVYNIAKNLKQIQHD